MGLVAWQQGSKLLTYSISSLFLAALLFAGNSYALPVPSDFAAYWRMDDSSGSATDERGSHNLTETSGTIPSASGKLGNARDFEAGDIEWFQKSHHADLGNVDEDMTIACWVNLESKAANQTI